MGRQTVGVAVSLKTWESVMHSENPFGKGVEFVNSTARCGWWTTERVENEEVGGVNLEAFQVHSC